MPYEKAPSSGAFLPLSLLHFLSGEPMHFYPGVDNRLVKFQGLQGIEWAILHGHSGGSMQERTLRRRYSSSRNP